MTSEEQLLFEVMADVQVSQADPGTGPGHNAWHIFVYQRRPYLEDECRDPTTGRINRAKVDGLLKEQWRRMSEDEKAYYVLEAQRSRVNDERSILVCTSFETFCVLSLIRWYLYSYSEFLICAAETRLPGPRYEYLWKQSALSVRALVES